MDRWRGCRWIRKEGKKEMGRKGMAKILTNKEKTARNVEFVREKGRRGRKNWRGRRWLKS